MKVWIKRTLIVLLSMAIVLVCVRICTSMQNPIEKKLIAEADKYIADKGTCKLNLATVFNDFDWDAVALFVAGDSQLIKDELGIETVASDGIAFMLNGKTIQVAMSAYIFPDDSMPKVSYCIAHETENDPYYIILPHENAVVSVEKYVSDDHVHKYKVSP